MLQLGVEEDEWGDSVDDWAGLGLGVGFGFGSRCYEGQSQDCNFGQGIGFGVPFQIIVHCQ